MIVSPKIGQLVYYIEPVQNGWVLFSPLEGINIRSGVIVNFNDEVIMLETVGWFSRKLETKPTCHCFAERNSIWIKLVN